MMGFLNTVHVLLNDSQGYAQGVTNGIRQTTAAIAEQAGRRKEDLYSQTTFTAFPVALNSDTKQLNKLVA